MDNLYILIAITLFKLVSLLTGLSCTFMGYKLFLNGFLNNSGSISGEYKDSKLDIKNVAPGIFFALFGSVIISINVWTGLNFNNTIKKGSIPTNNMTKDFKKTNDTTVRTIIEQEFNTVRNQEKTAKKNSNDEPFNTLSRGGNFEEKSFRGDGANGSTQDYKNNSNRKVLQLPELQQFQNESENCRYSYILIVEPNGHISNIKNNQFKSTCLPNKKLEHILKNGLVFEKLAVDAGSEKIEHTISF